MDYKSIFRTSVRVGATPALHGKVLNDIETLLMQQLAAACGPGADAESEDLHRVVDRFCNGRAPRRTACVCAVIMSIVTGSVFANP